jgi:hypothetical protein
MPKTIKKDRQEAAFKMIFHYLIKLFAPVFERAH